MVSVSNSFTTMFQNSGYSGAVQSLVNDIDAFGNNTGPNGSFTESTLATAISTLSNKIGNNDPNAASDTIELNLMAKIETLNFTGSLQVSSDGATLVPTNDSPSSTGPPASQTSVSASTATIFQNSGYSGTVQSLVNDIDAFGDNSGPSGTFDESTLATAISTLSNKIGNNDPNAASDTIELNLMAKIETLNFIGSLQVSADGTTLVSSNNSPSSNGPSATQTIASDPANTSGPPNTSGPANANTPSGINQSSGASGPPYSTIKTVNHNYWHTSGTFTKYIHAYYPGSGISNNYWPHYFSTYSPTYLPNYHYSNQIPPYGIPTPIRTTYTGATTGGIYSLTNGIIAHDAIGGGSYFNDSSSSDYSLSGYSSSDDSYSEGS